MTNLIGVPPAEIEAVWDEVLPLVEIGAQANRLMTAEDYREYLDSGEMQLWVIRAPELLGIVITEIIEHRRAKVCRIEICTGKQRRKWQHHIEIIERWARENGCVRMRLDARPGWSRVLKMFGYFTTHHVVEKDLV